MRNVTDTQKIDIMCDWLDIQIACLSCEKAPFRACPNHNLEAQREYGRQRLQNA